MKFTEDHRLGPETDRLMLRAWGPEDAEAFFELNADPEVMRYTGEAICPSLEAAREALATYPDWHRYGIGRWAAVYKPTGQVIGFSGLKFNADLDEVDVGYRFLPAYWGRGLATESALASLAYGFDVLGLDRIIGLTFPEHHASMRVLRKAGMVHEKRILYEGMPAELFALERH